MYAITLRRIMSVVLVLVLCLSLCACGNTGHYSDKEECLDAYARLLEKTVTKSELKRTKTNGMWEQKGGFEAFYTEYKKQTDKAVAYYEVEYGSDYTITYNITYATELDPKKYLTYEEQIKSDTIFGIDIEQLKMHGITLDIFLKGSRGEVSDDAIVILVGVKDCWYLWDYDNFYE